MFQGTILVDENLLVRRFAPEIGGYSLSSQDNGRSLLEVASGLTYCELTWAFSRQGLRFNKL
ncbi:MAG: hypothetical protein JWM91_342 [Rhodospirillales bacterium]|nr:hypothetical protein [Rhodospirillales bacterium]